MTAGQNLAGEVAFKLYDTYGFPLDLTQEALRARKIGVDTPAFDAAMARQNAEARKAGPVPARPRPKPIWFARQGRVGATDFLGYETERPRAWWSRSCATAPRQAALQAGEKGLIILNQTPFYAESGGQVGDTGILHAPGLKVRVDNTLKKLGDLFVHEGELIEGGFEVGAALELDVDIERRAAIRANHSATHLLHEALRQVLGDHVAQKGSLVAPDRLRFDFAHPKPVTDQELAEVEEIANRVVLENAAVDTRLMDVDQAIHSGARALFGEKYGDEVRVVSMGHGRRHHHAFSVELCGGTHVARTGDIGLVSIVGRKRGGRRRPAHRSQDGERRAKTFEHGSAGAARSLRAFCARRSRTPPNACRRLLEERRKLERELTDARQKLAMGGGAAAEQPVKEIGGINFFSRAVTGVEMKDLKSLADEAKQTRRLRRGRHRRRVRGRPRRRGGGGDAGPHREIQRGGFRPRRRRKSSAARAAAAVPTWPRPAAPTAPRRRRRSTPWRSRWSSARAPETSRGRRLALLASGAREPARHRFSRRCKNASRSNMCTSCSFLSSAPCSGGISFDLSDSRNCSGEISSHSSSFSQSSSSDVDGFFFRPGTSRIWKNSRSASSHQALFQIGEMRGDDGLHRLAVRET